MCLKHSKITSVDVVPPFPQKTKSGIHFKLPSGFSPFWIKLDVFKVVLRGLENTFFFFGGGQLLAKAEISHNHMPSGWNLLDLLILKLMLTVFFFLQTAELRNLTCFFDGFYLFCS